ncbi:toll-like receptor 13 [Condylostylus longicornis]|uniref:toll-like receptor 13 n=1 Tax=Condylostylus longicornis TaxID=2530218 RepID=UPI00244E2683|nr:toll-like receptor 13 [Condylostylus longicornis]
MNTFKINLLLVFWIIKITDATFESDFCTPHGENPVICSSFLFRESEIINITFVSNYLSRSESIILKNGAMPRLPINMFIAFPDVQNLSINYCGLINITKELLKPSAPTKFEILNLANNYIELIPQNAFEYVKYLKMLILTKNRIVYLDENVFEKLSLIEHIDISYNFLKRISIDHFKYLKMKNLQNLDLSYNNLKELDLDLFDYLTKLKFFNISHNALRIRYTTPLRNDFNVTYAQKQLISEKHYDFTST